MGEEGGSHGDTSILLVESDREASLGLAKRLRDRGWKTLFARDGVEGLKIALREQPSAIILNMSVPAGGGASFIGRIQRSLRTTSIPVIGLVSDDAQRDAALEAGAQVCLESPADPQAAEHAIENVLGRSEPVTRAPESVVSDPDRLDALRSTGLLDAEVDPDLDYLTRIAAATLGVPVALLSLVDEDRQFFATHVGLPEPWATARQTPLSHSFCQWVVAGNAPVMVDDAREHPVLRHNLAVKDIGVIAYAGVPMASPSGQQIGSFCGIDTEPRSWSASDRDTLTDLVETATGLLIARSWQDEAAPRPEATSMEADQAVRAVTAAIGGASRLLRRRPGDLSAHQRRYLFSALDRLNDGLERLITDLRTGTAAPEDARDAPRSATG